MAAWIAAMKEKMKAVRYVLLVSILVGLLGLSACRSSGATQRMESYLLAGYDPYIGLVRESPNANPNVYWFYSDNYLASLALEKAQPKIAKTITQSIAIYQAIGQIGPSAKWKVLSGEVVPEAVFAMNVNLSNITEIQGREIRSEVTNTNPAGYMKDWQDYADLLLLASINEFNLGNISEARSLFLQAQGNFSVTEIGFQDKAYTKQDYSTYKLALYLIAAEKVGIPIPPKERKEIENRILSLQDNDPGSKGYGGVFTDYDSNGEKLPNSDTNTETTSLVLLALH